MMKVSKNVLKAVILSVSLGTMVNNSASVILGSMESEFPQVPKVTLQCFVTYPSLMVMLFTLVGGVLTTMISTKLVLLAGLVIFTVSGMAPMVMDDFNAMLISRLCLGAGMGMVSPLAVSLITDFYEGEERVTLLGQQFAIGNVGQTASMLVVGFLAAASWRQSFWVYSIGALVFVIVLLFLPKNPPEKAAALKQKRAAGKYEKEKATARGKVPKIPCNWKVAALAAAMFCYNTTYLTTYSNLALVMKQEGIGSETMVGYAMALMTASGMCTGMFFGRLYQKYGRFLGAASAAAVGLSFFFMVYASHMFLIAVSLILMGAGNALLMPFGYYHVSKAAPAGASSLSMSVVNAAVSAGSFCSPFIFGNAVRIFGQNSGRFTFVLAAVVLLAATVGLIVFAVRGTRGKAGE